MAGEVNTITSKASAVASGAMNIGVLILLIVILLVLGFLTYYLIRQIRRYKQFRCVVWERDGFGQITETYDGAGIFVDGKTGNKRLFLRKANVGLNPDKIPYIPAPKGKKIIYLLKTGLKNFKIIKMDMDDPSPEIRVGEEDVNWGLNAYERAKKLTMQSTFMQLLPFLAIAFVSIIILIIFIYFFKEFKNLGAMAQSLKEAMQIISQAKCGSTIINP